MAYDMTLTEIDLVLNMFAVGGTLAFGAYAVFQKDFIKAVFGYAVSSAFLALLFYLLASPFAGVLELTVGAGLITILFLVALSLSLGTEAESQEGGGQ